MTAKEGALAFVERIDGPQGTIAYLTIGGERIDSAMAGGLKECKFDDQVKAVNTAARELEAKAYERAVDAVRAACEPCGGTGSVPEAGHGCDGDERRCASECPVELETQCQFCGRPIDAIRKLAQEARNGK